MMHFPFMHSSQAPGMAAIGHPQQHSPESPHSFRLPDPALAYQHQQQSPRHVATSKHPMTDDSSMKFSSDFSTPIRAPQPQHQAERQASDTDTEDIMPRTPTPPSPTASTISAADDFAVHSVLSPPSSTSNASAHTSPPSAQSPSSSSSSSQAEPLSMEALAHRFTDLISYPLCQLISDSNHSTAAGLLLQFDECIQGFQSYSLSFPHVQKHSQTFIAQLCSKKKMIEDTLREAGIQFPADPASSPAHPPSPPSSHSPALALAQAFPALKTSNHLVDDFRELRTLRSTLFGYLKLYEHRQSGAKFAVKMSLKSSIQAESLAENPLNELGFLRRINDSIRQDIEQKGELGALHGSNFICRLMAEYETPTHLVSVLQFASGGDLFDYLDKQHRRTGSPSSQVNCKVTPSPLGVEEARHFFIQLLQGVSFLHRLNICHLDLSLENLLLDDSAATSSSSSTSAPSDFAGKRLLICDFGAARDLSHSSEDPKKEQPFSALRSNRPGKLSTMSHEVFAGKDFHGSLADAYSCGVLFFMFLTSVPPYEFPNFGDKRFSLIFSGQLKRLIDAWKMNDRVPAEALEILSKLICPEERRWSVEQVLKHPWIEEGIKQMQAPASNQ